MSIFDGVKGTPKKKKGKWIVLGILVLLVLYVVIDGYFANKIEPQTVVAVYEPGGIRALVNETDTFKRMWKWPRILGTSIGVTEESVKIKPRATSIRFAMYTTDKVTGNEEDKDFVQAYIVDVKIKVKEWQKFFEEINLDEINKQRQKMGPFVALAKDRFEVIAYPIVNIVRNGEMTDRFGKPLKTEDGYPAMNLSSRMGYGESRLLSDRNIVICLIDAFGLKSAEEIKIYLKEREPWMWFAGVTILEQLADQHRQIRETIQSPLVKGLTWEGGQKRFVFGTHRLTLFAEAYQALYLYQNFLMETKAKLEEIDLQRKGFIERIDKVDKSLNLQAKVTVESYEDWVKMNGGALKFIQNTEQLFQNYQMFLDQMQHNITLVFMRTEVEAIKRQLVEAEKIYTDVEEEDKFRAEEFVQGLIESLRGEANREIWQLDSQGLNGVFNYYLAKSGLVLPEKIKQYFGLMVTKAYAEALEEKVIEAEKFLREVQIAKEFYLDIKVKLQGQKVDMVQLMRNYFSGKQELFQVSQYLLSFRWQEESLDWQKVQWERMVEEELIPFFKHYSESNDELAMGIRRVTAEENETLWDAAIQEVLEGEDISGYSHFWIHQVKEGETLAQITEKYNVSWQSLFGSARQMVISMVFRSLEEEKKLVEFNQLVAQAMGTGDYSRVYEFAKDVPLKPVQSKSGSTILVNKVGKVYSKEWFELDETLRKEREKIIKRYLYNWLEKFAPKVVEEYIPVSPWIDYIERLYGVEIVDVKLRIKKDKMFTKGGQPKEEYYELYYSEYGNAKLEEEEK